MRNQNVGAFSKYLSSVQKRPEYKGDSMTMTQSDAILYNPVLSRKVYESSPMFVVCAYSFPSRPTINNT